jgi:hypothetical protein
VPAVGATFRGLPVDPVRPLPLRKEILPPQSTQTPVGAQMPPGVAAAAQTPPTGAAPAAQAAHASAGAAHVDDPPPSGHTLTAEEIMKTIADAVVAAMDARDRVATAGNNGGSFGTKLDENTTEYDCRMRTWSRRRSKSSLGCSSTTACTQPDGEERELRYFHQRVHG